MIIKMIKEIVIALLIGTICFFLFTKCENENENQIVKDVSVEYKTLTKEVIVYKDKATNLVTTANTRIKVIDSLKVFIHDTIIMEKIIMHQDTVIIDLSSALNLKDSVISKQEMIIDLNLQEIESRKNLAKQERKNKRKAIIKSFIAGTAIGVIAGLSRSLIQ